MVKIKGTAKLLPPDEDIEVLITSQFADYLSPEVRAVTVDDDGLLTGISTDPKEYDAICRVIQYSKLRELDRLGPGVDLSSYKDESGVLQKVAFKFNPIAKVRRLRMAWDEINLLKSLPPHPNIVPFDRVVLEDVESRVIGFTTKYIPGGTLENTEVPLQFEWMKQLTELVDFLNLELGIMHQNIAPRNLLIDPDTNKLSLFDFNWAACGKKCLMDGRDDVTGSFLSLYELITNDTHFTRIPHWERNMDMVQGIPEWPCNRELDSDVSTFRNFVNEWVATRKSSGDMERYLNAPSQLTWPNQPTPPDYSMPIEYGKTLDGETVCKTGLRSKLTAVEKGQYVFHWEREATPEQVIEEG
ncbi:hypothetical protein UA08_02894 [Talaromyces atroroseus]|uniref:Protein kinase domain-containing protein n=1 Tax=Talaromyces atroroseus TaxID=1441469 RepID=A0A225ALG9_TALAT|nr:hypothetical protein UA08_02894 [Talaromyces atroroseus]OKL61750.1 hypothetical protein UA08_02894 [Talaromyces atroroseus]